MTHTSVSFFISWKLFGMFLLFFLLLILIRQNKSKKERNESTWSFHLIPYGKYSLNLHKNNDAFHFKFIKSDFDRLIFAYTFKFVKLCDNCKSQMNKNEDENIDLNKEQLFVNLVGKIWFSIALLCCVTIHTIRFEK